MYVRLQNIQSSNFLRIVEAAQGTNQSGITLAFIINCFDNQVLGLVTQILSQGLGSVCSVHGLGQFCRCSEA